MFNRYDEFSVAINEKNVFKAEEIFSLSDNRSRLIEYYLKDSSKICIKNVCSAFRSKGLREQALLLCDRCEKTYCNVQKELQDTIKKVHLTAENNRESNFVNHSYMAKRLVVPIN